MAADSSGVVSTLGWNPGYSPPECRAHHEARGMTLPDTDAANVLPAVFPDRSAANLGAPLVALIQGVVGLKMSLYTVSTLVSFVLSTGNRLLKDSVIMVWRTGTRHACPSLSSVPPNPGFWWIQPAHGVALHRLFAMLAHLTGEQ